MIAPLQYLVNCDTFEHPLNIMIMQLAKQQRSCQRAQHALPTCPITFLGKGDPHLGKSSLMLSTVTSWPPNLLPCQAPKPSTFATARTGPHGGRTKSVAEPHWSCWCGVRGGTVAMQL